MICDFCGKNLPNQRTFSVHLTRMHPELSTIEKEWYRVVKLYGLDAVGKELKKYLDADVTFTSLSIGIGGVITLLGIRRSHSEEKKTKRYKEKIETTCIEKYGVANPSQCESIKNKKADTAKKNYGSYSEYLAIQRAHMRKGYEEYVGKEKHEKVKERIQETCFLRYGHYNFGCGDKAKEKSKASNRKRLDAMAYEEKLAMTSPARSTVNHRGGFSSGPEKRVRALCISMGYEVENNCHLWDYNYDIKIGNLLIEVQGDMWHANPQKYKPDDLIFGKPAMDIWAKDERKKIVAEANGFTVVYIWENVIKRSSDDDLRDIIRRHIEREVYGIQSGISEEGKE